ncbi:hypothetical protein KXS15_24610 [Sinorhizobium meliloti]|uniref:hypothetical protein n=1 Tax=Rhizobium meliloti TaxID=382 RepID=UPI003F17C871
MRRPAGGRIWLAVQSLRTSGVPPISFVAICANINALPIAKASDEVFSYECPGVTHVCGMTPHSNGRCCGDDASSPLRCFRRYGAYNEEAEPLVGRRIIGEAVLEDVASVLGLQVDHADGHNRRL